MKNILFLASPGAGKGTQSEILAQKFNLFYQKHKVIGSEDQEFRLALTAGVGQVIKNGLNLLGIAAPAKM